MYLTSVPINWQNEGKSVLSRADLVGNLLTDKRINAKFSSRDYFDGKKPVIILEWGICPLFFTVGGGFVPQRGIYPNSYLSHQSCRGGPCFCQHRSSPRTQKKGAVVRRLPDPQSFNNWIYRLPADIVRPSECLTGKRHYLMLIFVQRFNALYVSCVKGSLLRLTPFGERVHRLFGALL